MGGGFTLVKENESYTMDTIGKALVTVILVTLVAIIVIRAGEEIRNQANRSALSAQADCQKVDAPLGE